MRFVIEGSEEAIKLADKVVKLATELRSAVYDLEGCCGGPWGVQATLIPAKETDPAAATTEPEKND